MLPESQFGTDKIRNLLHVHLHLRLHDASEAQREQGKTELHIPYDDVLQSAKVAGEAVMIFAAFPALR